MRSLLPRNGGGCKDPLGTGRGGGWAGARWEMWGGGSARWEQFLIN